MATLTMPFCLEMLTFGHPESSGALQEFGVDAGTAYGHSHSAFLFGNAYMRHPERSEALRKARVRGDRLWPLAQCLFVWKCLHSATQRAPAHSRDPSTRGGPMATRTMPFCLEMLTFCHPENSWGTRVSHSTRGGHMATRTVPFCLEMLTFCHPESSGALRRTSQGPWTRGR